MAEGSHPFVLLAKRAIETYVSQRRVIEPPSPLPEEFRERAGVFVSLKKKKALRGCIGTLGAERENLAEEIINNAISAATEDPRFPAVDEGEFVELDISVDVLGAPTPVEDPAELDPKRYGVIVTSGFRKGLLLPDLEGVDTAQEQLDIAKRKAGISPGEPVEIDRFEVRRYR
jgi:AmmeMemoRadiSam system protein A